MSFWKKETKDKFNLPNPKIEILTGGKIRLLENFVWGLEMVPAGFICDGTSMPKIFHGYVSPLGKGLRAALFHDLDYRSQRITRKVADARFYDRLILLGMRRSKAWFLWTGLRTVGWITWKRRKNELDIQRKKTLMIKKKIEKKENKEKEIKTGRVLKK